MKRFAIFDMDGTLIDSIGGWGEICRDYLAGFGIDSDARELASATGALTVPDTALYLKKAYALQIATDECEKAIQSACEKMYLQTIPAKKGALDYLAALDRLGTGMCIVSATPRPSIMACLDRLGMLPYFAFVISCEETGVGKEKPAAFLQAAERFGARPEDVSVYEDSYVPLMTAKKAGFHTVAVFDSYASNWTDSAKIADETITDWEKAKETVEALAFNTALR